MDKGHWGRECLSQFGQEGGESIFRDFVRTSFMDGSNPQDLLGKSGP